MLEEQFYNFSIRLLWEALQWGENENRTKVFVTDQLLTLIFSLFLFRFVLQSFSDWLLKGMKTD